MERRIPYRRGFKQPQFCTKRCRTKTERNRKASTPFHRGLEHTKNGKACKTCAMEALQERRVAQRSEKHSSSSSSARKRGFLVPCKACGMKELAFLPNLPTRFGKAYLAQISRILSFGIRFGGFPGECLHATARQTDMSFPARLYAGSSRSYGCVFRLPR